MSNKDDTKTTPMRLAIKSETDLLPYAKCDPLCKKQAELGQLVLPHFVDLGWEGVRINWLFSKSGRVYELAKELEAEAGRKDK